MSSSTSIIKVQNKWKSNNSNVDRKIEEAANRRIDVIKHADQEMLAAGTGTERNEKRATKNQDIRSEILRIQKEAECATARKDSIMEQWSDVLTDISLLTRYNREAAHHIEDLEKRNEESKSKYQKTLDESSAFYRGLNRLPEHLKTVLQDHGISIRARCDGYPKDRKIGEDKEVNTAGERYEALKKTIINAVDSTETYFNDLCKKIHKNERLRHHGIVQTEHIQTLKDELKLRRAKTHRAKKETDAINEKLSNLPNELKKELQDYGVHLRYNSEESYDDLDGIDYIGNALGSSYGEGIRNLYTKQSSVAQFTTSDATPTFCIGTVPGRKKSTTHFNDSVFAWEDTIVVPTSDQMKKMKSHPELGQLMRIASGASRMGTIPSTRTSNKYQYVVQDKNTKEEYPIESALCLPDGMLRISFPLSYREIDDSSRKRKTREEDLGGRDEEVDPNVKKLKMEQTHCQEEEQQELDNSEISISTSAHVIIDLTVEDD